MKVIMNKFHKYLSISFSLILNTSIPVHAEEPPTWGNFFKQLKDIGRIKENESTPRYITPSDFCERVQKNKSVLLYIDRSEKLNHYRLPAIKADTNDSLRAWLNKKNYIKTEISKENGNTIYSSETFNMAKSAVNECAEKLTGTKYAWFFNLGNSSERKYSISPFHGGSQAYALYFDDGAEALEMVVNDTLPIMDEIISKAEEKINIENTIKAEKSKREIEELTALNRRNADEAATIERQKTKEYKDTELVKNEIKTGNIKAARSCGDIASSLSARNGTRPLITPPNTLRLTIGKLESFEENSQNGNGYVRALDNSYSTIKTSASTLWFNKNKIHIGDSIAVVGKYTNNSTIKLTTGAVMQVPVLDLICAEAVNTLELEILQSMFGANF
jgi:hypothetical protein